MDEGHQRALGTRPRLIVDQPHPASLQLRERRPDVVDAERHMMEAWAALLDKPGDRRIAGGRLEQFQGSRADRNEVRANPLRHHLFGGFDLQTQRIAIERQRLRDVADSDADVIERGSHWASGSGLRAPGGCGRCCLISTHSASTPFPVTASVFSTGCDDSPAIASTTRSAPSRSALLTTKISAISMMPALSAWTSSPAPGLKTTTVTSAVRAMSTSAWPTPTVSMITTSRPAAASTLTASAVAVARPPSVPRVAMLRMNTPSSAACACIRTRSPRMAPPVNGLDGSTASTPTVKPSRRIAAISRSTSVLFPAPGGPVTPTTRAFVSAPI